MNNIKRTFIFSKRLKEAWVKMEHNERVSPSMYLSFMQYVRWQNYLLARIPVFYYAEDEEHEIVLIAPMSYSLVTRKYNTLGDIGQCGIADFLYHQKLSESEQKKAVLSLAEYIGTGFRLSKIPSESITIAALEGISRTIAKRDNVIIHLEENYHDNIARLSRSVRQNLRTAYNRLERDGKSYRLEVHYGSMADARKMRTEILDCYENRQLYSYSKKMKWLRFEYHKIGMKYFRHDKFSLFGNENSVQVALYIDGKVAGMYAGVLNHRKDCILVPRLAINMDYKFYSPGYVMLCESFKYFLSNTSIRNIDLSVGSEQYKLDLGGIMYSTEIVECCAFPRKSITFASSNA